MKNMLKYRGYYGTVEYSDEDECFLGKVFGINDLILFEGDSVKALKADFHEAVDSYLESCEERGKEPDKFYKGSSTSASLPNFTKKRRWRRSRGIRR